MKRHNQAAGDVITSQDFFLTAFLNTQHVIRAIPLELDFDEMQIRTRLQVLGGKGKLEGVRSCIADTLRNEGKTM